MSRRLLSESQASAVRSCAYNILEKSGFRVLNDKCLDALDAFGCTVDRSSKIARLSEPKLTSILQTARKYNADPTDSPYKGTPVGGIQPLYMDRSGQVRAANTNDLMLSLKIADNLDGVTTISPPLTDSSVDSSYEPVETLALLMKTCRKPLGGFDFPQPGFAEHMVRLGEIYTGVAGSCHFLSGIYCVTTPLTFSDRVCRCMIEKSAYPITAVPTPMPISGVNVPLSPYTAMAMGIAEIIAGWAIALALNPETPISGLICTGSMDMATGKVRFSSMEAIMQDAGVLQVLGTECGTAIWCAHCYTDAVEPGFPAVADKYYKSLMLEKYGAGVGFHQGTLDAGKIYSNEQLAIDIEVNQIIQREMPDVEDETDMMLDLLQQSKIDVHQEWMWHSSTIDNMRKIQEPLDLLRPEQSKNILARAAEKCDIALAKYIPPELSKDQLREIDHVVSMAKEV